MGKRTGNRRSLASAVRNLQRPVSMKKGPGARTPRGLISIPDPPSGVSYNCRRGRSRGRRRWDPHHKLHEEPEAGARR